MPTPTPVPAQSKSKQPARKSVGDAPVPPLRPRRKLFILLSILYVIFMAALVVMYFTTVRGQQ